MVLRADPSRLLVSRVAAGVANDCAELAKTFRGPGAFARGDQLVRASLSIVSNIAEACGRGTVPDFRRFLLASNNTVGQASSGTLSPDVVPSRRCSTGSLHAVASRPRSTPFLACSLQECGRDAPRSPGPCAIPHAMAVAWPLQNPPVTGKDTS